MKRVDIVCITSKLCNLRCRYCYELQLLDDARRMSLADVEQMFVNIASHYQNQEEAIHISFCWHGGEPLLIPPDVYRRMFEIQRRVFGRSRHRVSNAIQSNFTVMSDDHIALLRDFDA